MQKIVRFLCIIAAFLCVLLGVIGIVLPILPTTPFLLLAAILFARGSEYFHRWFLSTRLYKKYIESFLQTKAMTKKEKCSALSMITVLLGIGFIFSPVWYAKALIIVIAVAHYIYISFRIKTVKPSEKEISSIENKKTEKIMT